MLLKGKKIVDFSHRLPGPLGTLILKQLGAEVIKMEDHKHQDPFLSGFFKKFDPSFESWYNELNRNKEIKRLDYKSENIKSQIREIIQDADAVIIAMGDKLKIKLGLDQESLESLKKPIAFIDLKASLTDKQNMHDMNAMSDIGLMHLYLHGSNDDIVAPPFLPVSGIAFGQQIATDTLGAMLKAKEEQKSVFHVSSLLETADKVFTPFWPKDLRGRDNQKYLHNGAYPCYSFYKTSDGSYIGIAAVEERFWDGVEDIFKFGLSSDQRFQTDQESFAKVSSVIKKLSLEEIKKKIGNKDLCISYID